MAADFRPLTQHERDVLEWMLEPRFPGRDELRAQLAIATVRPLDDDGCLEFECTAAPPAPVRATFPCEGEYRNEDGVALHVQLYVRDGFMRTLEMYTEDGSAPRGLPQARELKLFAPHSDDAGVWSRDGRFG